MVIPCPPPVKPLTPEQKRAKRAQAKRDRLEKEEADQVEALPVTNGKACGIDIGDTAHWVCVGFSTDPDSGLVKQFASHTEGLRLIVAFLRQHGITTVAMESTGIYWVALFELLTKEGFHVILVDPTFTKQVRGRPKTDKLDAQWIFRLHSCGLLPAAFRPDEQTAILRSLLRLRGTLTSYAGRHVQHMQKALQQMNLKLTNVLSDITGVTGRKIILAILEGERDPMKLAALRNNHCKRNLEEIAKALDGSYRDEHLFALKQAFEAWQFYLKQIEEADEKIQAQLDKMKPTRDLPLLAPRKRGRGRKMGEPGFDVRTALYYVTGVDLTQLEGLDELSALILISEIGCDMSKFPTVKQFCAWLGLCPNYKKTGGKVKSSRTRPGKNRAARVLRVVASGLDRSQGALGAFLRRMKGRMGKPAAITATAHKLAQQLYQSLRYGIQYVRKTQEQYEEEIREKQLASLKKRARQMGFELTPTAKTAKTPKAEATQTPKAEATQTPKAEATQTPKAEVAKEPASNPAQTPKTAEQTQSKTGKQPKAAKEPMTQKQPKVATTEAAPKKQAAKRTSRSKVSKPE